MFEFFKRKNPPRSAAGNGGILPIYFRDGTAALECACKYMECPLKEGSILPALVLDTREMFGTPSAVKIQKDGSQLVTLRVASNGGGFVVPAVTAGTRGPKLQPGQLVAWQAMKYSPEIGAVMSDKKSGWVGLVIGTLKPEHRDGQWVGDERFTP